MKRISALLGLENGSQGHRAVPAPAAGPDLPLVCPGGCSLPRPTPRSMPCPAQARPWPIFPEAAAFLWLLAAGSLSLPRDAGAGSCHQPRDWECPSPARARGAASLPPGSREQEATGPCPGARTARGAPGACGCWERGHGGRLPPLCPRSAPRGSPVREDTGGGGKDVSGGGRPGRTCRGAGAEVRGRGAPGGSGSSRARRIPAGAGGSGPIVSALPAPLPAPPGPPPGRQLRGSPGAASAKHRGWAGAALP